MPHLMQCNGMRHTHTPTATASGHSVLQTEGVSAGGSGEWQSVSELDGRVVVPPVEVHVSVLEGRLLGNGHLAIVIHNPPV